jgi:NADH-quinone oxidoreductase subunit M
MGKLLGVAIAVLGALGAQAAAAPGPAPRVAVTPAEGQLADASASGTLSFTLRNVGAAPLELRAVRLAPGSEGFDLAPVQPRLMAPGDSVALAVTYTPDGRRAQAFGALQIVSNDDGQVDDPHTVERDPTLGVPLRVGGGHLLSLIVLFPLVGVIALVLLPRERARLARRIALGAAAVPLAGALVLYARFDPTWGVRDGQSGLQFVEHTVWVRRFAIEYFVGVDGLNVMMVVLTAIVAVIAILASWPLAPERGARGYFALLLLAETGLLGVFCSLDFFLFYAFFQVVVLPMYLLIGVFGGTRKQYAALKFFLFALLGSVLLLVAIVALHRASAPSVLVDGTPTAHTFDMLRLTYANCFAQAPARFGVAFDKLVWSALFLAFAIQIPVFPLHTWLPDTLAEAPTAISVLLAAVLLKLGTYGILRVNCAMLPDATRWAGGAMAAFGVVNILYGGLCAMAQRDLKRLIAYAVVSHMGYCLLGVSAFTAAGVSGAVLEMWSYGAITAMLLLMVGALHERAHTRDIDDFGGLAQSMPAYATWFGFALVASLGLPGLSGFVAEMLTVLGAFALRPGLAVAAAAGVVLTAAYHLGTIQRVLLGPPNPRWQMLADLSRRERVALTPLALLVLILGFYPSPVLGSIHTSVDDLLAILVHGTGAAQLAVRP